MLLPIFVLAFAAFIFLSYRMLSNTTLALTKPKFLTIVIASVMLLLCFSDRLVGSALGYVWVSQATKSEKLSIPMRINFPFWHFFDAETSTRESSYGQPRSLEPLYGIDFYFDEMISRGYSQIGVIHPYSYGKKYLLSVTNNPDSPTCNFFQNLPKTQGDTTSKIPWLLGRYTKDAIKKAGKTLIDGNNAACISVTISEHSSVEVIEEYEVKAFEILDVQLQYRATRRLVSVASNQILFESREVWSDGGWFAKYVLANPATGVSGRGYRYGNATMPFTIPSSPQTVNKG